jgi:Excreted virulence factor EspC, type VII ESX diderm
VANLAVTPGYLEKLATKQDEASKKAGEAAGAASDTEWKVWLTHGVISGISNGAFSTAEGVRRSAGANISRAASDLAAKLRTASQTYESVDEELRGNIDKQVLPK